MPEAEVEAKDAWLWYDRIRPELGLRFARAIEATVNAIAEHPMQFPAVHRSRRRAGVRYFPYGISYEVQEQRIVVLPAFMPSVTRSSGRSAEFLPYNPLITPWFATATITAR